MGFTMISRTIAIEQFADHITGVRGAAESGDAAATDEAVLLAGAWFAGFSTP
jgi:hypothetical protein